MDVISMKQFDGLNGHFRRYEFQDFILNEQSLMLGLVVKQAGYIEAGPKYILNSRTLNHYSMIYVSKGAGIFKCLGKDYELKPHTVYFLFPGVMHSYTTDIKNLFFHWWIDFYGYNAKILMDSLGVTAENPVIHPVEILEEFREILFQTAETPTSTSLAASCKLYRLLGNLLVQTEGCSDSLGQTKLEPSNPFYKAKSFLEANYRESISIDEAARTAEISSARMIRLFKTKLGCSPSQYLAMLRLDSSKKMLLETNRSIIEIANASGFNDSHYFSRFFRKHTGFSPEKWRAISVKLGQ